MSFGLYLVGYLILIIGLAYGAHLAHVPDRWIVVGILLVAGVGVIRGVRHTRRPDPS